MAISGWRVCRSCREVRRAVAADQVHSRILKVTPKQAPTMKDTEGGCCVALSTRPTVEPAFLCPLIGVRTKNEQAKSEGVKKRDSIDRKTAIGLGPRLVSSVFLTLRIRISLLIEIIRCTVSVSRSLGIRLA